MHGIQPTVTDFRQRQQHRPQPTHEKKLHVLVECLFTFQLFWKLYDVSINMNSSFTFTFKVETVERVDDH
jgi:hypothetical protein